MANRGFICPGCGKFIRSGDDCVLIHVRNGVPLGQVMGAFDGYDGIYEEYWLPKHLRFGGEGNVINSAEEIHKSKFRLGEDSGVSAWHLDCFRNADTKKQLSLTPSETITTTYNNAFGTFEEFEHAWNEKTFHETLSKKSCHKFDYIRRTEMYFNQYLEDGMTPETLLKDEENRAEAEIMLLIWDVLNRT